MAQANVFQEGVDRVRDAFGTLEDEFQRAQKRLRARRRSIEKRVEKQLSQGRKDLEKRTRKLRDGLRKNPALKRLESWRRDATRQIEQGVESVLATLQIASKGDLQRIDRKLNQLNRKMKDLERTPKRAEGAEQSAA